MWWCFLNDNHIVLFFHCRLVVKASPAIAAANPTSIVTSSCQPPRSYLTTRRRFWSKRTQYSGETDTDTYTVVVYAWLQPSGNIPAAAVVNVLWWWSITDLHQHRSLLRKKGYPGCMLHKLLSLFISLLQSIGILLFLDINIDNTPPIPISNCDNIIIFFSFECIFIPVQDLYQKHTIRYTLSHNFILVRRENYLIRRFILSIDVLLRSYM